MDAPARTADSGGRRCRFLLLSMTGRALALHETAHARCFIASSVSFPVRHEPEVTTASPD